MAWRADFLPSRKPKFDAGHHGDQSRWCIFISAGLAKLRQEDWKHKVTLGLDTESEAILGCLRQGMLLLCITERGHLKSSLVRLISIRLYFVCRVVIIHTAAPCF